MRESNSPGPAVRPAGQKQSSGLFLGRGDGRTGHLPKAQKYDDYSFDACVILSRSGAGEERKRLLFPRAV